MRKISLTSQFVFMFLLSGFLFGQNGKTVNKKIKNIKGEVNKITITTDKGETVFYNKEAKALFKKLKKKSSVKLVKVLSADGENADVKVLVNSSDDSNADVKTITLNEDDEDTTIKVITSKDDKKNIKIYTGKDAEKFLEENKDLVNIKEYTKDGKKVKTIILKQTEDK